MKVLLPVILIVAHATGQIVWFEDHFAGNGLSAHWVQASGQWGVDSGGVSIETRGYDQLLSTGLLTVGTTPYEIETELRGVRAGVFFHIDDRSSKILSHMVRFDDANLLVGYFTGAGEFRATSTFPSPSLPVGWTRLRIRVNPIEGRYSVFVNDIHVGTDSLLFYRSGYVGLQASDGRSEFKYLRVTSDSQQLPLPEPGIGDEVRLRHLRFIRSAGSTLEVYNKASSSLQRISESGEILQSERGIEPKLRKEVRFGGKIYRIDSSTIVVTDPSGVVIDSTSFSRLSSPAALIADRNGSVYVSDPGTSAIHRFDSSGNHIAMFTAASLGGFRGPFGLDWLGDERMVIADYDRIVIVDSGFTEVKPMVDVTPNAAKISWEKRLAIKPAIRVTGPGTPASQLSGDSGHFTAEITGLESLSRYSLWVSPTLQTIPPWVSQSHLLRFTTPPADSESMAFTRLPVLYMVYRTINYRDRFPKRQYPQVPDGRTISDEEIEYLKQSVNFNREFYFRNSRARLVLDFDFIVVQDTLWLGEVGPSDPYWLSPNDRVAGDFERAAKSFGKKPEYYTGLISPYAWVNYPPRRTSALRDPSKNDSISIRQAYGGGTYGVPAPWRYGKTAGYTGNPFQDRYSRQDWLITHEFHHQIDALMEASGYSDYYHCDLPWKMPGRFGEDFDFNAAIIRAAPPDSWLGFAFGRLAQTRDADGDGVPDDDPTLPLDERRLGGNSNSVDSDGDGLDDLAEMTAGSSRGSHLDQADSDDDGIPDGSDPQPLYAFNGVLRKIESESELLSHRIGQVNAEDVDAEVFAGWDDRFLYIRYSATRPVHLLIQIDGQADGWFHGFDNIQTRILAWEDSVRVVDYYLRDCSDWVKPPRDVRGILKAKDLKVTVEKESLELLGRSQRRRIIGAPLRTRTLDARYMLLARIPRKPEYGFELREGQSLGIRIGLQTATDLWVWHELFERNAMMKVTLQK